MKNTLVNAEEYNNPIQYDKENMHETDVPFLKKWAEKQGGKAVELCCGTGRAAIPLSKAGVSVIGIDIHPHMLEEAKKKYAEIKWLEQDCTKLTLTEKNSFFYMVGNSMQHFLTNEDQDHLFASITAHMEEEGVFIFDIRFPNDEELLQPEKEMYWRSYTDDSTGKNIDVYTISRYDAWKQIQHYTTIRKLKGNVFNETTIRLRYIFPQEMERLLRMHGFQIEAVYKDWNETLANQDSEMLVYVCRKCL